MRGCEVARFEVRGCEVVRLKIFHIPSDDIFLDSFVCTNGEVRGCEVESYIDDRTTRFLYNQQGLAEFEFELY